MGQIVGGAAKPKRCNLNKLSQLGTPAAGEHILVSSDNSMNAAGQGNFDCYIVGDGTTAATALELKIIGEGKIVSNAENSIVFETLPVKITNNAWATTPVYNSNQVAKGFKLRGGSSYTITTYGRGITYAVVNSIGANGDGVSYASGYSGTLNLAASSSVIINGIDNAILYLYFDIRDQNSLSAFPDVTETRYLTPIEKAQEDDYITIDISHLAFFGRRGAQNGSGIMANSTSADFGKLVTASGSFKFMCASDYIYIGDAKQIVTTLPANRTYEPNYGLCFYSDKNDDNVISGFPVQFGNINSEYLTYTHDVPANAKYVRTTWWYIGNTNKPTYPDLFKLEVIIKKEDVFLDPIWKINLGSSLKGKKLSIIGDSISTFSGWLPSDRSGYDGASYAAWYAKYYGSDMNNADEKNVSIVADTWWYQLLKKTGMELLSNASWSASTVCGDSTSTTSAAAGCSDRRIADLSVDSVTPDIVVIWIGINDFATGNTYKPLGEWGAQSKALPEDSTNVSTFSDAYALMVYKVLKTYPKAKVFCCTMLQSGYSSKDPVDSGVWPTENTGGFTLDQYNDKIKEIAHALGAEVIDLAACGIHFWNFDIYTGDSLHPNYQGMRLVENYIGDRLLECVSE